MTPWLVDVTLSEEEVVAVGLDVAVAVAVSEVLAEGVALAVWLTVPEAVGVMLPDDVWDAVIVLDDVAVGEAVGVAVLVKRQATRGQLHKYVTQEGRTLNWVTRRSDTELNSCPPVRCSQAPSIRREAVLGPSIKIMGAHTA